MSDESDEISHAIERLRGGDHQALAGVFTLYRERLRKMIDFRLDARLRGRVSASDVLQEAYIDALKRLEHYRSDPDIPFFVWLRSVAFQRVIDVHRHHLLAKGRDAGRDVPLGVEASSEKMAELMGDLTSPSQAAGRAEVIASVRAALDRLEPIDREVLALRHFEELGNREAAAVLGIGTAAASKRYVRALERLKEALEALQGPEGGDA